MRRGMMDKLLAVVICTLCLVGTGWAAGGVIYVDAAATGGGDGSTWADAYVHLQDALAAASGADKPIEIRVAQGTYRSDQGVGLVPGDREATFQLINGVTLKGGYGGSGATDPDVRDLVLYETVLWGGLGESSPDYLLPHDRIVTGSLTDATAVLDGFTIAKAYAGVAIEGGSPTLRDILFKENIRGLDIDDGSPSLTGCIFMDNDYGIHAWDCNSVLTDCLFEHNLWGTDFILCNPVLTGCLFRYQEHSAVSCGGSLELFRCSFLGNNAFGSGVVDSHGTLIARQCTFKSNTRTALRSTGDTEIIDCALIENSGESKAGALEAWGYTLKVTRCQFVGNSSQFSAGAIANLNTFAQLSHCIFVGNSGSMAFSTGGAIRNSGRTMLVSNCTFADNRGRGNVMTYWASPGSTAELNDCIVWDGPEPFTFTDLYPPEVIVNHSNVQGGYEGVENIDVDPEFVQLGYWADPDDRSVEIGPDDPNAVWVMGDYHLKSQAGHWDVNIEDWVYDDMTSPCIDAGDPNSPLGDELFPNGGYVNLGAYGGTMQASRAYFGGPVCQTQMAGDINGDCVVDQTDMDILLSHWLTDSTEMPNMAPTISILSPADGAEITYPDPILFHFDASDPDGTVVYVNVSLTYNYENGSHSTGSGTADPTNNWEYEQNWGHILHDGVYTVHVEAVDDKGTRTAAAEITLTLHPEE